MKLNGITKGDQLFHAVHGLCRVNEITKESQAGKQALYYSLVPKSANRMKVRFVISSNDMTASGFHALISVKEANKILNFLKVGTVKIAMKAPQPKPTQSIVPNNQLWMMAAEILSFSQGHLDIKEQRKRRPLLESSARGLVGELALVFGISLSDAAEKVRKSLENASKVNPIVLEALSHASED